MTKMTDRPRIAAITEFLGHSSNVWMHRQFAQLDDQLTSVIAWEYLNQEQFPLPNTEISIVPEQFSKPLRGWKRTIDSITTPRTGGRRFGPAFNHWLQTYLQQRNVEAVLGQFGYVAMDAEVACRPIGIPVFAHFHGFDLSSLLHKKRYLKSLQSQWHAFAGMVVVAQYQRDFLLDQGADPDMVALIPCGAPMRDIAKQTTAIRHNAPRDDSECRFLFIGRFTAKKDPISVLEAFQRCHFQHPHSRLRLAGFGELEESCKEWVKKQSVELRQAVQFLGILNPQQVIHELALSDVFVQHSRVSSDGDMEGWPVAIGEAMAAGLPIVSTRHAGIVDQVLEGHSGYLCDEGDWPQMGLDMIKLAANHELRQTMGAESQQRGLQYDATDQIQQLREFMNYRIATSRVSNRAA